MKANVRRFSSFDMAQEAAAGQRYWAPVLLGDDGRYWVPATNREAGRLIRAGHEVAR